MLQVLGVKSNEIPFHSSQIHAEYPIKLHGLLKYPNFAIIKRQRYYINIKSYEKKNYHRNYFYCSRSTEVG